jgi:hypothetical protein
LCAAIALALFVRCNTETIHQMVAVVIPKFDPGSCDGRELSGAIDVLDVGEPGPLEQLVMGSVSGDGHRTIPVGAAPPARTQSRCGVDR